MKDGYHHEVILLPGHGCDGLVGQLGRLALGDARVAHTVELFPPCVRLRRWRARVQTSMETALKRCGLIAYRVLSRSWFSMDVSIESPLNFLSPLRIFPVFPGWNCETHSTKPGRTVEACPRSGYDEIHKQRWRGRSTHGGRVRAQGRQATDRTLLPATYSRGHRWCWPGARPRPRPWAAPCR